MEFDDGRQREDLKDFWGIEFYSFKKFACLHFILHGIENLLSGTF